MDTTLVPYLNFDGKTAEAMQFYQSILGGELTMQTFGEAVPDTKEESRDRTMHAELKTDELHIMASDTHPDFSKPHIEGTNVNLSIIGSDMDKLTEYFTKLAEGGTIDMPLEKQFWGDTFGMCTDKFGIHWMVNISSE